MLLEVINDPPLCGPVAVAAFPEQDAAVVELVDVAAVPLIFIPQVPEAPVPVGVGGVYPNAVVTSAEV